MTTGPSMLEQLRQAVLAQDGAGLTDGQLLECYLAGRDEAAFAALVRRHGPMVLGVCRRVLRHEADAEDAFQATFLVLVKKAHAVVPRELVGHWLYGVAYRTALKARALAARRRQIERQVTAMPSASPQPADRLDLGPLLDRELSRLPEKHRLPLVLCGLEGKSKREAARQLNLPEGTLSSRLARAREALRARLARRGVTLAAGALAAALSPSATAAPVPPALLTSTVRAAAGFAAGKAAAGVASATVAALTEGVLNAMLLTKLKAVTAVLLAFGLLALGATLAARQTPAGGSDGGARAQETDPPPVVISPPSLVVEEKKPEAKKEQGKTDPPGAPLEVKLVVKQDTYPLDLGGKKPDEFRKAVQDADNSNPIGGAYPPPPDVDLVLELKNTSDKDIKLWKSGDEVQVLLDLQGPAAFSHELRVVVTDLLIPPAATTLAPGKVYAVPIRSLKYGFRNGSHHAYWLEPGEYTLAARFVTAVSPAPKGAGDAGNGFGYVTATAAPVKLKVVDKKAEEKKGQAKTDPPGVPLEAKLVAKKDTYTLDLKGKTPEEFRKEVGTKPPPAEVDLELEVRNTGAKEIRIYTVGEYELGKSQDGGDYVELDLKLEGPGAVSGTLQEAYTRPATPPPVSTALAPGKSFRLPIKRLLYGTPGVATRVYKAACWTQPGEYTLTASFKMGVSPAPEGAKGTGFAGGFGYVTLTSAPVKLKVVDKKAEAKTDPPGAPLEASLVVKQDTYPLDLGGKKPDEFRKLLENAEKNGRRLTDYPPAPAVDLVLELKNPSDKDIQIWNSGDPVEVVLDLQGPGAKSVRLNVPVTLEFRLPTALTLGPGKTHRVPITKLSYGPRGDAFRAYWTEPGEYTLTASFKTAVSPASKGAKDAGNGFGFVTATAAPVKLKVVKEKEKE